MMTLCPDPSPFEPKINRLGHCVEDYYCAKFQVIPICRSILILDSKGQGLGLGLSLGLRIPALIRRQQSADQCRNTAGVTKCNSL